MIKRAAALALLLLAAGGARAEEGRILKEIRIQGAGPPREEEVRRAVGLKPGAPLTEGDVAAAGGRALLSLKEQGFMEAAARAAMDAQGVLWITVREGALTRFGDTRVEGLEKLPPFVVKREREYQGGDPYDRRKLFRTRTRLYLTGLFETIQVDASTTPAKTADVRIRVKERPLRWIKGGVGWGSEERQRVTLTLTDENLFHRAYKGELTAGWSAIWVETRADFVSRYFLGTRTQLRTSAGWRHEDREGNDFESASVETTFGRALAPRLTGSASYQIQRTVTFNVDPQIAAVTPDLSDTRSVILGLNWDRVDDPFFPAHGERASLRGQRAGGALGGTIHFNKASTEAKTYQSLGRGWVAAFAARAGASAPFNPSPDIPIFDRFFTGGGNSVRGYRERGVGPKDDQGNPLGGTFMTGGSVELRFPLLSQLLGALFLDGGMVALAGRQALPSEWKYGAGGGVRVKTPVGPIRLDYGYKLNRDPGDNDLWRLHLSLGESF